MSYAPPLGAPTGYWMDRPAASRYARVPQSRLLSAASQGDLDAVVTHPRRPGEWMVRMHAIDRWLREQVALV